MRLAAAAAGLILLASGAQADPLRVYAAGSLSGVVGALVTASGIPAAAVAPPVFGPAGLLRQRIEGGEAADLFLSADLAQPDRIAAARPGTAVMPFARNRTCAVGAASLGLSPATVLDRMLDPSVRIGTSTPGADPGGDYAQAVFARAEAVHRGAEATLKAKAQALFGGPTTMVPLDGHTPGGAVLLSRRADLVLYYCSSAPAILKEVPDAVSVPLPPALEPDPVYGLAVLGSNPDAAKLALFMLSAPGQAILARNGLLPVLAAPPAMTVLSATGQPATLTMDALRGMASATAALRGEGGAETSYAGPSLWSVLVAAGAVDPDFHHRVRQTVTVAGADGYTVTLGLGEIDPEFENKPALLAIGRGGSPLDRPRLVLPGDKRPGRSVRDVVSVEVR